MKNTILLLLTILTTSLMAQERARDLGIPFGVMQPDVVGVEVGQISLIEGENVRTGVTAILPYRGNIFQNKVPAAIYLGNGFGKLAGYSQVKELGNLETPIILTNTLSVPTAANGLVSYTLQQTGNEDVRSVNPVVGETNDGRLNDIRARKVTEAHVLAAI